MGRQSTSERASGTTATEIPCDYGGRRPRRRGGESSEVGSKSRPRRGGIT